MHHAIDFFQEYVVFELSFVNFVWKYSLLGLIWFIPMISGHIFKSHFLETAWQMEYNDHGHDHDYYHDYDFEYELKLPP